MNKNLKLSIFEVVGDPLCVASSDGQKVYDRLGAALKEGQNVTLSFRNVTMLTAAFLNAAIGQLYGTFSEKEIRSLLKVQDMRQDDIAVLKHVVETAKGYFKDTQKVNQAKTDGIIIENLLEILDTGTDNLCKTIDNRSTVSIQWK